MSDNKTLLEKYDNLDKRLSNPSNYINNATIQFISNGDSNLASARPYTTAVQSADVTPTGK